MNMVYASPPPRRARASNRDSEADVDTRIYVRPTPQAWDRQMVLQILTGLGAGHAHARAPSANATIGRRPRAARPPVPAPGEPNVFLQPWTPSDPPLPWATAQARARARAPEDDTATALASATLDETLMRGGRRRRSMMPWVLFLSAFGLAYGIGHDRVLRAELASELRGGTVQALAVVQSSAMRLGRYVAELR